MVKKLWRDPRRGRAIFLFSALLGLFKFSAPLGLFMFSAPLGRAFGEDIYQKEKMSIRLNRFSDLAHLWV